MDCHKSISWWKIRSNETFVTARMIQYYKKRNGLPMLCKNKLEPDNYSCLGLATVVLFKLTIIYSEPKTHFLFLFVSYSECFVCVQYSYCYHLLQFHSIDRKSETHSKVNQVPIFLMLLFLRLWWLKLLSKATMTHSSPIKWPWGDKESLNVSPWPHLLMTEPVWWLFCFDHRD